MCMYRWCKMSPTHRNPKIAPNKMFENCQSKCVVKMQNLRKVKKTKFKGTERVTHYYKAKL